MDILAGQPVLMLGELVGETWLSSRTWYLIEVEGVRGFVHSTFITEGIERPTVTAAPPILYYSSDDSGSRAVPVEVFPAVAQQVLAVHL